MAGGREFSQSQRKIINRYYDNQDTIVATRLGEIVTDIALNGDKPKKLDQLWKRAEQAISKTSIKPEIYSPVLEKRDTQALARMISKLQ
ncbi:MAG: hypothetical protein AB8C13_04790 [Phycisphaerales bacterium]